MSKRLSVFKKSGGGTGGGDGEKPAAPAPTYQDSTNDNTAPPPAYGDAVIADGFTGPPGAGGNAPGAADVTASFAALRLSDSPRDLPDADTCLAHLKLLFALQSLKEDVGYMDGLWGLWDSRADDATARAAAADASASRSEKKDPRIGEKDSAKNPARDESMAILSQLREKRWAVFLARAVDRYEAWWDSLPKRFLTVADMDSLTESPYYTGFVKSAPPPQLFDETRMPPLGKWYHPRLWTIY